MNEKPTQMQEAAVDVEMVSISPAAASSPASSSSDPWHACMSTSHVFITIRKMAPKIFGCVEWIPAIRKEEVIPDIINGLIIGVMLLPQTLSYTSLLQFPQTFGLNSGVVSGIAYAIFGSVPFLSVAAAAETTTFMLNVLDASGDRMDQARSLAVISGLLAMGCSMLRVGSLLKIIMSRAVGDGYMAGASLLVIVLQIKGAFNLPGTSASNVQDAIKVLIDGFKTGGSVNSLYSFLLFSVYVAYLTVVRYFPRIPNWMPHQLIVLIVSILVTWLARLDQRIGLSVLKSIPAELPTPSTPSMSLPISMVPNIIVLTLICFLQNYTVSSAGMSGVDANREMWASGAVNLFCGLFNSHPVAAGFGRSGILRDRKAKSPLVHVVVSCVIIVALGGLARVNVFYYLPNHAMCAILTVAMSRVIDLNVPRRLWRVNKFDLVVWLATFFLTLFTTITYGILVGIGLSLLFVIVHIARPHTSEMGYATTTGMYMSLKEDPESLVYPRVLLWRFEGPLYFVNLSYFEDRLKSVINHESRPIDVIIVNCASVLDIDSATITQLPLTVRNVETMHGEGVKRKQVLFAQLPFHLERQLVSEGIAEVAKIKSNQRGGADDDDPMTAADSATPSATNNDSFNNNESFFSRSVSFVSAMRHGPESFSQERPLLLFRNMEDAKTYGRAMVHYKVVEVDLVPDAPRPAVAYLTDLIESQTVVQSHGRGDDYQTSPRLSAVVTSNKKVSYHNNHFNPADRELVGCVGVVRHADRTPKQKLKVFVAPASKELLAVVKETKGKQHLLPDSPSLQTLSAVITSAITSTGDRGDQTAVSTRMLQLIKNPPPGLTWQVKEDTSATLEGASSNSNAITVVIVAKWGGQITEEGKKQACRHGRRLVPRFFACGDISHEGVERFGQGVAVMSGSDDRLIDTACTMANAIVGCDRFQHDCVHVDDALLLDLSRAKGAIAKAADALSDILHCRSYSKLMLSRHLRGISNLVHLEGVEKQCDPRGVTPFDVMLHIYNLMEKIAGGAQNVEIARREGEAANGVVPVEGLESIVLAEHETGAEFRIRWAALAASFQPRKTAAVTSPTTSPSEATDLKKQIPAADASSLFTFERPFDTTCIPKIADYVAYDTQHNVVLLQAAASTQTSASSSTPPQRLWSTSMIDTLTKLEPAVTALSQVVSALSNGMTSSERFICGSLVVKPLIQKILSDFEELSRLDASQGIHRLLQRRLELRLEKALQSSKSSRHHGGSTLPSIQAVLSPLRGGERQPAATPTLVRLYFAPNSHLVALQHCLFDNHTISGFHCSEEYRHQSLGYMTHLMFKVYRIARSQDPMFCENDTLDSVDPLPEDESEMMTILQEELRNVTRAWHSKYRYGLVPFLSTGMQIVSEQEVSVGEDGATVVTVAKSHASQLSLARIHTGFGVNDFRRLSQEVEQASSLFEESGGGGRGVGPRAGRENSDS